RHVRRGRTCSGHPRLGLGLRKTWMAVSSTAMTGRRVLPHEVTRGGSKQFIRRYGLRDDALGERMAYELVEHAPVGRDAVGERIAGDVHHAAVQLIDLGGVFDPAGL